MRRRAGDRAAERAVKLACCPLCVRPLPAAPPSREEKSPPATLTPFLLICAQRRPQRCTTIELVLVCNALSQFGRRAAGGVWAVLGMQMGTWNMSPVLHARQEPPKEGTPQG